MYFPCRLVDGTHTHTLALRHLRVVLFSVTWVKKITKTKTALVLLVSHSLAKKIPCGRIILLSQELWRQAFLVNCPNVCLHKSKGD